MTQTFMLSTIPPSVNTMFPTVGTRRIKSADYVAWRSSAALEIKAQRPEVFAGTVSVAIEMRRPTKSSDVDNRIKATLDLLSGLAFDDDKQVHLVSAAWVQDVEGTRITVSRMV